MIKVLIVDDDIDLGDILQQYLALNDMDVERVYNGQEALDILKEKVFDVLLIDVMMPGINGYLLAEKIKKYYPQQAFLFITARHEKKDRLKGLKLGADDYITKPFDVDELILRIQNILKRQPAQSKVIRIPLGNYIFDVENYILSTNNYQKILTQKEADLLKLLCENRNTLIKRDTILNRLWEEPDFFAGRSLDVFMSKLRKYLSHDPNIEIESIRGVGFYFNVKE